MSYVRAKFLLLFPGTCISCAIFTSVLRTTLKLPSRFLEEQMTLRLETVKIYFDNE